MMASEGQECPSGAPQRVSVQAPRWGSTEIELQAPVCSDCTRLHTPQVRGALPTGSQATPNLHRVPLPATHLHHDLQTLGRHVPLKEARQQVLEDLHGVQVQELEQEKLPVLL